MCPPPAIAITALFCQRGRHPGRAFDRVEFNDLIIGDPFPVKGIVLQNRIQRRTRQRTG